jgi:hypothetical protein
MDRSLEQTREAKEAEETATNPAPEPEARTDAYVFDGWSYEPLKLTH